MKLRAWLGLLPVLSAVPGAVSAQTMTLYGIVDTGLEYLTHVPTAGGGTDSIFRMSSGNLSTSRFGLRGVEDLGAGLKAVFTLENGFDSDTGSANQGGRLFGRQAHVGLQNRFGTLSLGRHQTLLYDLSNTFDPLAISTRYSILMHDRWMSSRSDNSVKLSGTAGGVYYGLLYSTGFDSSAGGEIPGAYKAGKEMSAALGYATGPFAVRTLYDEVRGSTILTQDNVERRAAIAGSFAVGSAKILAGYRYYAGSFVTSNLHTNLYWAGAQFQATPTISITGTAYYTDVRRSSGDPYSFVLTGSYAFSKRTDLYAVAGYARNRDGSSMALSGFGPSLNPNAVTFVSPNEQVGAGESQFGAVIGVRHRF